MSAHDEITEPGKPRPAGLPSILAGPNFAPRQPKADDADDFQWQLGVSQRRSTVLPVTPVEEYVIPPEDEEPTQPGADPESVRRRDEKTAPRIEMSAEGEPVQPSGLSRLFRRIFSRRR